MAVVINLVLPDIKVLKKFEQALHKTSCVSAYALEIIPLLIVLTTVLNKDSNDVGMWPASDKAVKKKFPLCAKQAIASYEHFARSWFMLPFSTNKPEVWLNSIYSWPTT
jgi:hypothetical protein